MASPNFAPKPSTSTSTPAPNVTVTAGAEPVQIDQEKLDKWLKQLLKEYVRGRVDKEKVYLYAQARLMEHYFHGRQQLVPKLNERGEVIDFTPTQANSLQLVKSSPGATDEDAELNQWIINDFRGDVKKFVSVLGSKSPNVAGRSRWPSDPTGTKRARVATDCGAYLFSEWKMDSVLPQIVEGLALRGPVFLHFPWRTDESLYGSREVEELEEQEQKIGDDSYECLSCGETTPGEAGAPPLCAGCGKQLEPEEFVEGQTAMVPVVKNKKKVVNGTVGMEHYSVLEVTTPFWVTGISDCSWLFKEKEYDPAWIMEYWDPEGKLKNEFKSGHLQGEEGTNYTAEGRKAREEQANPWGSSTSYLWTGTEYYIRPMMYRYLDRICGEQEEAAAYIQHLRKNFPAGMKIRQVGTKLLSKENISMDWEWEVVKVGTEKYLYEDPHFADYVQLQDMTNDAWGMEVELRLRHIPITYFDPEVLPPEQVNKPVLPGQHIPLNPGHRAGDAIHKSTPVELVPTSHQYIMTLREIARELVGLMPAVFGGDDPTQTAEQARRKLNQALMVLAIVWNNIREGFSSGTKKAILQLSRYSGGVLASADGSTETSTQRAAEEISDLLAGGWVMVADQAIPMNWSQLKDFVFSMFQGGEAMAAFAQAAGATSPSNLEKFAEGLSIPGWKIPGVNARRKLLSLIDLLLKEEPIEMGQDPSGTPILGPSRPYQSFIFDPQLTVDTIREWLLDPASSDYEGTPGYDNVLYFGLEAQKALAPPPGSVGGGGGMAPPGPNPVLPPDPTIQMTEGSLPPEAPEAPLAPLPEESDLMSLETAI